MNLKLLAAIDDYRSGNPYLPGYNFLSENLEEQLDARLSLAKARSSNPVLEEYYTLGSWLHNFNKPINDSLRSHQIATFLYEFFSEEPDALPFLKNVSTYDITQLSRRDRDVILAQRPLPLPDPIIFTTPSPQISG